MIYQWRGKTCYHSVFVVICVIWLGYHSRCVNLSFIVPSTHLNVNGENTKQQKVATMVNRHRFRKDIKIFCVFFFRSLANTTYLLPIQLHCVHAEPIPHDRKNSKRWRQWTEENTTIYVNSLQNDKNKRSDVNQCSNKVMLHLCWKTGECGKEGQQMEARGGGQFVYSWR